MRKLASIRKIISLTPIDGADNIVCAQIDGWEVVVKKDEFQPGDLCIYCEIDSILPEWPQFEFLRSSRYRIKTRKIRGQISQGIAFKVSDFITDPIKEGTDVTELLNIVKYDPEEESIVIEKEPIFKGSFLTRFIKKHTWKFKKFIKKLFGIKPPNDKFPEFLVKTDEERVQNCAKALLNIEGNEMYITEKLEGSSTTYFYKNGEFGVCGRNKRIFNKIDPRWRVAIRLDLPNKLKRLGKNVALQGELIGPKIQGNIYGLETPDVRIFIAYDIDNKKEYSLSELQDITQVLDIITVPILMTSHILLNDIKYYVELSKGKSLINSNKLREGIVIRLLDKTNKNFGFSFKSINPEYLLKQD